MVKGIKKLSIEKAMEKRFSTRKKQDLHRLKRVGLIVDADAAEVEKLQSKLLSVFSLSKNQLSSLIFKENKEQEKEQEIYFSEKDFTWRGRLKKESKLNEFLAQDFDLLINYFSEDKLVLHWVSASAEAKLKVGLANEEKRLNDIEIVVKEEEIELFMSELKKYVNIITDSWKNL
ncbi:DUF6913 domain-containing protein [Mesonia profundi]